MIMRNYVISLTTAEDRRIHIKQEFGKQGIDFEFFDAVTPTYNQSFINIFNLDFTNSDLSDNEISCFLSHLCLWKKCLDENLDYIAIFEDDIYLSADAYLFLNYPNWIDSNINIIKIEKINKKIQYNTPIKKALNHKLIPLKQEHLGAGGYILSKQAIIYLLNFINKKKPLDHIDQIIFNHYLQENQMPIYQLNPVLCIQDCILFPDNQKFSSSLQWREKIQLVKRNKTQVSLINKAKRELIRLSKQIYQIFYPNHIKLIFNKS